MEIYSRAYILMMIARKQIKYDRRTLKKDERRELKIIQWLDGQTNRKDNHAIDVVGYIADIKWSDTDG